MTKPQTAAADTRRPVIFVNPHILDKTVHVGVIQRQSAYDFSPGVVSVRNEQAEALVRLLDMTGGQLVCTETPYGGYDVRTYMLDRGIKGAMIGPEWFAVSDRVERGHAIDAWLVRYGSPPALVIDRPGGPTTRQSKGKLIALSVGGAADLTMAHCHEAARLLREATCAAD